jgi:hypothetical protein
MDHGPSKLGQETTPQSPTIPRHEGFVMSNRIDTEAADPEIAQNGDGQSRHHGGAQVRAEALAGDVSPSHLVS